ncbi:MAG TPA: hypothetical protein DHW15_12865 [Bacteroidetes bacterium]|mgnify:CR=1 FL=1|jgi:hypothetical protein|nr:MAG: hypothetical protein ABR94_09685 [Sphingobacteriales bacterium BACL12 MAG-120802-bin5]KRP13568.1 MAG: hypothetical protein ABR95_08270 [Sphingobacteriales bacterium BACL12 MAG-120813-bin55]HCK23008.1 hypothetical protein [Bacteroidota bacterium]
MKCFDTPQKFALPLLALLFLSASADLSSISGYISTGNAKGLSAHFDNLVELHLDDQEGTFSRTQAEQIMKDFFRQYPPRTFSFLQDGISEGANMQYAIGTYVSGSRKFRTYVYLKKRNGQMLIQELSFQYE